MVTLRKDDRQWLISDEASSLGAMHAIEAMALRLAGAILRENEIIELRAVGTFMERVADARERRMSGQFEDYPPTKEEEVAIGYVGEILRYLVGTGSLPDQALDELHAIVFSIDSATNASGVSGPGFTRELVRGEHDGR